MGNSSTKTVSALKFLIFGVLLFDLSPVKAFEIKLQMTGDLNFPGILKMDAGADIKFERLCFLGEDTSGLIDVSFLEMLAEKGIPEGNYQVTHALPDEKWPTRTFSPNGALRFSPLSDLPISILGKSGKNGLAIHAKDFFPLAAKLTKNPKMVLFFSDQLFEKLIERWGALRISNWDMGRFQDFYKRNTRSMSQWRVNVEKVVLEPVKTICEPLKVQRKPGAAPE